MTPTDQTPSFGADESESLWSSVKLFIAETLKVVFLSLAIIIPVRYFLIQPFYVKGASMEPTYLDHEYLIIDEISYRWRDPVRGEVVVFRPPNNQKQYYIKRVIGIPGDRVKVTGGRVYLYNEANPSGEKLDEPYLGVSTNGVSGEGGVVQTYGEVDVVLKDNQFFVLGDHREASLDSRVFGPIDRRTIVGRTWLRGWPVSRFTVFPVPSENGL